MQEIGCKSRQKNDEWAIGLAIDAAATHARTNQDDDDNKNMATANVELQRDGTTGDIKLAVGNQQRRVCRGRTVRGTHKLSGHLPPLGSVS